MLNDSIFFSKFAIIFSLSVDEIIITIGHPNDIRFCDFIFLFYISSKTSGFSNEDKSPNSVPINFAFSNLRIILPVRVFGKSDN